MKLFEGIGAGAISSITRSQSSISSQSRLPNTSPFATKRQNSQRKLQRRVGFSVTKRGGSAVPLGTTRTLGAPR